MMVNSVPIGTLMLAALLFVVTGGVVRAEKQPLACQEDVAVGMNWENGGWRTGKFESEKFILVLEDGNFTKASAAKAMAQHYDENSVDCESVVTGPDRFMINCSSTIGTTFLNFDSKTMKGGVARMWGSMDNMDDRDSVIVSVFTCTPY